MEYIEISQGFLIFQVRRLPSTGRPSDRRICRSRRTWWNSWGTSCYFLQKISDTFGFSLHNCSHLVLFSRMNLLSLFLPSSHANTLSWWLQEPAIPKKTLFVGRFSPQTKPTDMLVAPLVSFFYLWKSFWSYPPLSTASISSKMLEEFLMFDL